MPDGIFKVIVLTLNSRVVPLYKYSLMKIEWADPDEDNRSVVRARKIRRIFCSLKNPGKAHFDE